MRKTAVSALLMLVFLLVALCPISSLAVSTNVRVAVNTNMPPYQFADKNGACVGIHVDMFDQIAEDQNLQVEYVQYSSDAATLNALESGEVDIVLGARSQIPVKYDFQQTGELSSSTLCLVAKDPIAEEIDATGNPYSYYIVSVDYLTDLAMSWAHLDQSDLGIAMRRITPNAITTLETLQSGAAQICVIDKETIVYCLNAADMADEYTIINNYLMTASYTLLVRSSDTVLQRMLEAGLSDLRVSGGHERIRSKWIKDLTETLVTMGKVAGVILVISLVVLAVNMYINYTLKRKVALKTHELLEVNSELNTRMAQLQQEQTIRNGLIENSPSGMVLFDSGYIIRIINRQAQLLAAEASDAKTGGDARNLPVFGEILTRVSGDVFVMDAAAMSKTRLVTLTIDGKPRVYRYNIYSPLAHEQRHNVLMMVADVTVEEAHRREAQEEEKNRSLNMLIAGISHEIKNPLMAIQTYTSTISRQINNPEYLASFEKNIPQEVRRINRLVEALTNYARPVKGEMERFSLSAVVSDCLYLARASIGDNNIVTEVELNDGAYIFANKDKLKQTIINLVTNGVESMSQKLKQGAEGPLCLHISMERDKGRVKLFIRDEGSGMTETEILRCTEPFFTTKAAGTGLGMSLAKQYVQDNNGTMTIRSEKNMFTEIVLSFEEVTQYGK